MDSDFRIRSGILYVLTQAAGQGHIYLPWTELEQGVTALLLIDIRDMERHIMDMAIDKKIVVRENASGEKCIYASMYYYMEASIAKHLIELNIPYSQDEAEMFAYFKINEKEYLEYKRTQLSGVEQPEYNNLELILSDQTTYPYKGTVETVEGDFERGTGSIAFRARFANPDRLLRHGVSGKIRMLTEMENVILVPQRSTFEIQDFTYVYTVDEEGKVSVRSFEPLSRHGAYYVTKDLPDNTLIVYEGVQQVSDGMVITPEIVDTETVRKQLELSDEVENNK